LAKRSKSKSRIKIRKRIKSKIKRKIRTGSGCSGDPTPNLALALNPLPNLNPALTLNLLGGLPLPAP
jgi:hypothetical protein